MRHIIPSNKEQPQQHFTYEEDSLTEIKLVNPQDVLALHLSPQDQQKSRHHQNPQQLPYFDYSREYSTGIASYDAYKNPSERDSWNVYDVVLNNRMLSTGDWCKEEPTTEKTISTYFDYDIKFEIDNFGE